MNMFEQQKQMRNITDDNQLVGYMQDPMMQQAAMQEMQRRSRLRQSDLAQKPMPQDGAAHFAYGSERDVALFDPYGTDLVPAYENYFTSAAESLGARGGANNAVSVKGASGRMQIIEATAKGMGMNWDDRFDEDTSIKYGSQYNNQMRRKFGEDPRMMNAAYNAGPGRVNGLINTYGNSYDAIEPHLPKETRDYVAKIKVMRDKYLGNGGTAGAATTGFTGLGAAAAADAAGSGYRNDPTMLDELKQETERANATEEELRFLEEQNNREFLPPEKLVSKGQPLPQGFGFSSTGSKDQLMGLGAADRQNPVGYAQGGIVGTQQFAGGGVPLSDEEYERLRMISSDPNVYSTDRPAWNEATQAFRDEAARRAAAKPEYANRGIGETKGARAIKEAVIDPIISAAEATKLKFEMSGASTGMSEAERQAAADEYTAPPTALERSQATPEGPSMWDRHIEESKQRGAAFEKQLGQVKDWFGGGAAPEAATMPSPPGTTEGWRKFGLPAGEELYPTDAALEAAYPTSAPQDINTPPYSGSVADMLGEVGVDPRQVVPGMPASDQWTVDEQKLDAAPTGPRVAEVRPGGGFIGNQYRLHDYADQQMRSRKEEDRRYRNQYFQTQRYNLSNNQGLSGFEAYMAADKAARRDHASMRQSAQGMGLKDVEMQNRINTRGLLYEGGLQQAGIAASAARMKQGTESKRLQYAQTRVKDAQVQYDKMLKIAYPNGDVLSMPTSEAAKKRFEKAEKKLRDADYTVEQILRGVPFGEGMVRPQPAAPTKRNIFGDTTMGSKPTL